MFRRVEGCLLNYGSRYEVVIWFILALYILPLITTINDLLTQVALGSGTREPDKYDQVSLFASTSYVSGHLRATMKRRRGKDE
jgi:hypothetical protein